MTFVIEGGSFSPCSVKDSRIEARRLNENGVEKSHRANLVIFSTPHQLSDGSSFETEKEVNQ